MNFDYDLFVIGGGSGGVRAARLAAETGARVGLAEEYRYGGTCVIRGCVPKKLLVYASGFSEAFEDAGGYGWSIGETRFDWASLIAAKDREIARLESIYRQTLQGRGVKLHDSRARISNPHQVELDDGTRFNTKHILVATGGSPFIPVFEGAENAITSNEAFNLRELPRRIIVVGGGYIACEFAGILNGLGVDVTQLYRGEQILRGFDDSIRSHVAQSMKARGVNLHVETDVAAIRKQNDEYSVLDTRSVSHSADLVLYATGRRPNTSNLGLEETGVSLGKQGEIKVDIYSQTSVPSIFAVGDVTNRVNLTPVAIRESVAFVKSVFEGVPTPADHELIPTAVFTQPEVGTIGMTETEALELQESYGGIEVYESKFRPLIGSLSGRDEMVLVKLVVAGNSRQVLGCHIVGHAAAEMIQLAGVAVKMGATKEDFDRTVAVHPTTAEELVTLREPVTTN